MITGLNLWVSLPESLHACIYLSSQACIYWFINLCSVCTFDECTSVSCFMYCVVLSIFRFQEKLGCCRNTYRVSILYSYLYNNETYCV